MVNEEYIRENLTVIVTVRNRRNTLPRAMSYYKDFPASVIFLDSTQECVYPQYDMARPNQYLYVPGKNYMQKLYDCLSSLETKYSIVVCDDDFLFPTGLEQGIRFLEENEDYVSYRGHEVGIWDWGVPGATDISNPEAVVGKMLGFDTVEYLSKYFYDFKSDDRLERIREAWTYFQGADVHSVVRNDVQTKIHKFHLDNPEYNSINYFDKNFSFLLACYGNSKILPVMHLLRSEELNARSLKRRNSEQENIEDWKPDLSFKKDFLSVESSVFEEMASCDRDFLVEVHSKLCNEEEKKIRYKETIVNHDLFVDPPEDGWEWFTPLLSGDWPLCLQAPKTRAEALAWEEMGLDLVAIQPKKGPGADFYGAGNDEDKGFSGHFNEYNKYKGEAGDLYPVLKQENLSHIKHIIEFMNKYPLIYDERQGPRPSEEEIVVEVESK